MKIKLSPKFTRDLKLLAQALTDWDKEGRRKLEQTYRKHGLLWQGESKKRVPVDEGRLEKSILAPPPFWNGVVLTQEVGTNVEYGPFLEFGTERIAGGDVKAIGDKPEVSDLEAVHTWPAKEGEAIDKTSDSIDTSGGATGALRNAKGQFTFKAQEQMPFLRTGFVAIKPGLIADVDASYEPPKARY